MERLAKADMDGWSAAVDAMNGDHAILKQAFLDRWQANAPSEGPAGLPSDDFVALEMGWSAYLELFFLSFETDHPQARLVAKAIQEAYLATPHPTLDLGEVWLTDILALRRYPPPQSPPSRPARPGPRTVSLEAARTILKVLAHISRDVPAPDRGSYLFFRRIYAAIVNALVSEIVEAVGPGAPAFELEIGRRIVAPEARSVFRTLAGLAANPSGWRPYPDVVAYEGVRKDWKHRIGELTDTLAHVNEGLDLIGRQNLENHAALVEDHRDTVARLLDDSFYRLLMADCVSRPTAEAKRLQSMLRAIRVLHEASNNYGPPAGMTLDRAPVQAMLWHGQKADPILQPQIGGLIDWDGPTPMTQLDIIKAVDAIERRQHDSAESV
jgi:hypothetical protein